MKNYELTSWANGFGIWHCRVDFAPPGMGNTPEAERIKYAGLDAAKRRIRKEITSREAGPVRRLHFHVIDNKIDSLNRLWSVTVAEKITEDK